MKDYTEIENEIKAAQDNLKSAMAKLEEAKSADSDPRWKPESYEGVYFSVNGEGDTGNGVWTDHEIDEKYFANGNCFKTREQAEKHAERLYVFNNLWALADAANNGEIISSGYRVYFLNGVIDTAFVNIKTGQPIFKNEDDALKAISLIGKDKIKGAWSNE